MKAYTNLLRSLVLLTYTFIGMLIKIGTRGSRLALWQAEHVAALLQQKGLETALVIIETKGDKILDKSLSKIGSKGVFTEELEQQLRSQEIDIAVHSAKDVPSEMAEDLTLIAFTEREQANDVLLSHKAVNLTEPITIGTSSTRRVAMLRHYYPHIRTVDMRGNLQTRIRKLEEGQCDALLLAYAGVHRMGYEPMIAAHLPLEAFTPAAGQGSIAIQVATSLAQEKQTLIRQALNHSATEQQLLAERAFLHTLQGGCSVPVFALASWQGELLHLQGGVVSLDGQQLIRHEATQAATEAESLGRVLAEKVLASGGEAILKEIKAEKKL